MCEETEASWPVPGVVLGYQSNGFSFCFLLRLRDQLRREGRRKQQMREEEMTRHYADRSMRWEGGGMEG